MAIFGYSWGGGTTYKLSTLLTAEGIDKIAFTAYVDGIRKRHWRALRYRPPGSACHANYYQRQAGHMGNTLLDLQPEKDYDEVNVTTTDWGAQLTHRTIDNHENVMNGIIEKLKTNVNP